MGRGEDTRQAIIDHAVRRASEVGLVGLTIGELARGLKMSKSGLYAHFGSKDALQVAVIEQMTHAFTDRVIRPALKAARGEPRVRAFLEHWLGWHHELEQQSGCPIIAATSELDDRPGPARDMLAGQQQDLMDFLASITQVAKNEGHFRNDLDEDQFAFEVYGVMLVFHLSVRLLEHSDAIQRVWAALERLIIDARSVTN